MTSAESLLLRQEKAAKAEKIEFARELAAGLLLLRYKGKCTCGMMLTDRDQNHTKNTFDCPHCGRSGRPSDPA
jgi:hypothetical protein